MARESDVSAERVAEVCVELWAAGKPTSFNLVYEALGRKGSASVVQKYITQWRQDSAERLSAKRTLPDLPPEIVSASDQMLDQVWKTALATAENSFVELREKLAGERAEIEASLELATGKMNGVERENLRLAGEIQGLTAHLAAKNDALQEVVSRLDTATITLASRDEQVAGLRENVASLLASIESDRARHASEMAAERARADEKLSEAEKKYQAELARIQEIAEGARRHLMEQTDAVRQAAKLTSDNLKAQLATLEPQLEGYRLQANAARDEASKWRGKAEILQETVVAERARADRMERELATRPPVKPAEPGVSMPSARQLEVPEEPNTEGEPNIGGQPKADT